METLHKMKQYIVDFLFPVPESVKKLEALSPTELITLLPRAQYIDEDTIALFDYKDLQVRELIWELKYKGNVRIAEQLAAALLDVLRSEIADRALISIKWQHPLLIPLPISNKRKRERGYNQTELLGKHVHKLDPHLCEYSSEILVKHRHTESQARTHATKRERKINLQGSMSAKDGVNISSRAIILLDDVTTSGSTFKEAHRALKERGAHHILCIAIAH